MKSGQTRSNRCGSGRATSDGVARARADPTRSPRPGGRGPSVERSDGSAVRAREWSREFREVVLLCLVYNITQYVTRQSNSDAVWRFNGADIPHTRGGRIKDYAEANGLGLSEANTDTDRCNELLASVRYGLVLAGKRLQQSA
jgi:hypothetical protein